MKQHRLNIALFLVLLVLAALNVVLAPEPNRRLPNLWWSNMSQSPAAKAFQPSGAFDNGRTLQAPPEGVVREGTSTTPDALIPADGQAVAPDLKNPLNPNNPAVLARGEEIFATFCAVCHGPGMIGDGPVTKRGVPAPPSLLTTASAALTDGDLYQLITHGRRSMPSYATQVDPDDRWKVIAYLRQQQREALR